MTLDWLSFALGALFVGFGWLCAAVARAQPKERRTGTLEFVPDPDRPTPKSIGTDR